MKPELQLTLACIGLALLLFFALSQYGTWIAVRAISRRLGKLDTKHLSIERQLEKLNTKHRSMKLQIGNMIGMLLKAGFKRGMTVDWNDDLLKTEVKGVVRDTVWDWKIPE